MIKIIFIFFIYLASFTKVIPKTQLYHSSKLHLRQIKYLPFCHFGRIFAMR